MFRSDLSIVDIKNMLNPIGDILWVLLMSLFLINAILILTVPSAGNETEVSVNTAGEGGGKKIRKDLLTTIEMKAGNAVVIQGEKTYILPKDLEALRGEGKFETRKNDKGETYPTLIAIDPGKEMTAGEMLSVVKILNEADIGVDFRTLPNQ